MPTIIIESDHDLTTEGLTPRELGLTLAPTHWRYSRSGVGIHCRWHVEGLPDWVDDDSTPPDDVEWPPTPDLARRRKQIKRLLRDALCAGSLGYDRNATNLWGEAWQRYPGQEATVPAAAILGRVLGRAEDGEVDESMLAAMESLGYEPGGRYGKSKCPVPHLHISGSGDGEKGTCVQVFSDGSGVLCRGEHSQSNTTDGAWYYMSTPRLLRREGLLEQPERVDDELLDPVRQWAERTPSDEDARNGYYAVLLAQATHPEYVDRGEVDRMVAATRLRYLLGAPPLQWPARPDQQQPFFWDADIDQLVQFSAPARSMQANIYKGRWLDVVAQYPGCRRMTPDGAWSDGKARATELLNADAAAAPRAGLVRARVAPVRPLLCGAPNWVCEHGAPVRYLLPRDATGTPTERLGYEDAVARLRAIVEAIPLPAGIADADAAALRCAWLMPALTETWPGQIPVILLYGASGAGKTGTVNAIQRAWHAGHRATTVSLTSARELENQLVSMRGGAVALIDEFGSTAVKRDALDKLKEVIASPVTDVRLFQTQRTARLTMRHAWYATSVQPCGPGGQPLEGDWHRRIIPIQMPSDSVDDPAHSAAIRGYVVEALAFAQTFPGQRVAALIDRILGGPNNDRLRGEVEQQWVATWPHMLIGWQVVAGIYGDALGLPINYGDFVARLQTDQGAIDLFSEWLNSLSDEGLVGYSQWSRFRDFNEWRGSQPHAGEFRSMKLSQFYQHLLTQSGGEFHVEREDGAVLQVSLARGGDQRWKVERCHAT